MTTQREQFVIHTQDVMTNLAHALENLAEIQRAYNSRRLGPKAGSDLADSDLTAIPFPVLADDVYAGMILAEQLLIMFDGKAPVVRNDYRVILDRLRTDF